MRILWLSHFVPFPPKGGALQRSHNLLREVARRHEVHLVSLNQAAILSTPGAVEAARRELTRWCARVEVFPILSDRSKAHWWATVGAAFLRPLPYDVYWLHNPRLHDQARALAASERFDLVHVDTLGLMPYGAWFGAAPIVLNHHNVESQMMARRAEREHHPLRRVYFRREHWKLVRMEQRVCPTCALNLVVSDLDARRLRETAGAARTAVVENGVDVDYFRPQRALGHSDGGLVFVGRLSAYANRDAARFFLREIWPALLAENPQRQVTLIGRDPPTDVVAAARDPRVVVPGFVEDIRPLVDQASIYVCPIRDGGGTRLKVLDALAMGKPLVATSLAVEGLDLVADEHYLRAESGAEFVAQIRRLETDPELRERLVRAGLTLTERRYSWAAIGATLDGVYSQVEEVHRHHRLGAVAGA